MNTFSKYSHVPLVLHGTGSMSIGHSVRSQGLRGYVLSDCEPLTARHIDVIGVIRVSVFDARERVSLATRDICRS
jgi:hypothetical protein